MSEIKWIKITTDIFNDEKIMLIESLPECDTIITIWFKLLCMAGRENNNGIFIFNDKIPYTANMLAQIFRRKETSIQLALKTFEEFGMIEIINNTITIPNWNKHQSLIGKKKVSKEKGEIENREYREEEKKENNKERNLFDEPEVEVLSFEEEAFNQFWSIYPKKYNKKGSFTSFKRIKNLKKELPLILEAVEKFKKSDNWKKENGQYIPYPQTFINQERWKDKQDLTREQQLNSIDMEGWV